MLKKTIASLLLICLALSGFAQDKSLLWKISGNGLTKPSYLFGTIHLICPTDFSLSDSTKNAMAQTGQVYLEIDMDDPALMTTMQKSMMNTSGKPLKDLLSADDYKLLDDYYTANLHMGLSQLSMMKPFALMSLQYMALLNCQPQSYEMTFTQMAGTQKKEVLGLETIDDQMSIFDKMPAEKMAQQLVDMVKKKDEATNEFRQLITLYKAQDLEGLRKLMDASQFSEFEGFEEVLLDQRNIKWIPVIEKAAKEKPTFFAVGAGHLAGEKGVIRLLRQKGYTVQPVK
ncbi:TraB/GumN family protein [Arsenicibacter rosenii]|uniref:TraB/GumN family protein n=1 Tax=Arsenicibacter rosenii TaxID=1750698 RepID=A0A1S2VHA4_9BACT|nr:TraB/GumN family protein [Arsenicibacter rosenii]OIN58113.1 TraB/GumN family protein [Arsenicibacter rosenii]